MRGRKLAGFYDRYTGQDKPSILSAIEKNHKQSNTNPKKVHKDTLSLKVVPLTAVRN
jgi:hypothetical protein